MESQKCSKCHKTKPLSEFFIRHDINRPNRRCKLCVYASNRRNYNHDKERWRKLQYKFGQSIKSQYDILLAQQGGTCALCHQSPKPDKRNRGVLVIDHDHVTGKVRGLLCGTCNRAIGLLQDNPTILTRAIQYLTPLSALSS